MSAAVSIIGQCAECCECPEATVEWDSASASLTKCGFEEFGAPSSPPKYYLTSTADGDAGDIPSSTWNNAATTLSNNCTTITYSGTITDSAAVTCSYSGSTAYWAPELFDSDTCNGETRDRYAQLVLQHCPSDTEYPDAQYVYVYSNTSTTVRVWATCGNSNLLTETLSDEYTTDLLKSNTVAALPAYDDDWNDTAGSYANLSSDELTYAIRESRYRIRFKIPKVGFGTCYKLTWVERFTPEGGGDPVDTPRNWQWSSGDVPEDYDPDDPSTYPIAGDGADPYFSLPVPESDGETLIGYYTDPEDPETYVEGYILAECRNCEETGDPIPFI